MTGYVELKGPLDDENLQVYINMSGRSSTSIKVGKSTVHDHRTLFKEKQVLYQGPCHLGRDVKQSWDFKFQLPAYVPGADGVGSNDVWAQETHELPPSICVAGFNYFGGIFYKLKAKAHKSTFFSLDITKTAGLTIRQRTDPTTNNTNCSRVFEKVVDPKYTWGTWFKGCWHKIPYGSVPPKFRIKLQPTLPTTMVLGEAARMKLEFVSDKSAISTVPAIKILGVEHRIRSEIWVRVPSYCKNLTFANRKRKTRRFEVKSMGRILEEGESMDFGPELGAAIPTSEVPSFRSISIGSTYVSKTIVKFEMEGEKRKKAFKVLVTMLPATIPETTI